MESYDVMEERPAIYPPARPEASPRRLYTEAGKGSSRLLGIAALTVPFLVLL